MPHSMMNRESTLNRLAISSLLILAVGVVSAQQPISIPRALTGDFDSEIGIPVANDTPGKRDANASSLLEATTRSMRLPEHDDIECKGTMVRGGAAGAEQIPITFVVGPNGNFAMTLQKNDGTHGVRVSGRDAVVQRTDGTRMRLKNSEFGMPLALPMRIAEIANRPDLALREDPEQVVDGQAVRVLAATLFPSEMGEPITAAFYFDKATSRLQKVAMLRRSPGYRPLISLEVVSYRDYRAVNGVLVPFEYKVTRNGQLAYTVRLDGVTATAHHEDSFFKY